MNTSLLVIDYTESCCLEKYERPEWGCTTSAVREMASRLDLLVRTFRESELGPVVWITPCPWIPGKVHPNIEALYASNKDAEFYTDGTGASTFYKLAPLAGERIFEKNLYSAFSGTDGELHACLQEQSVERLVIAGIYSTGCVNATICEAFHRGYKLIVVGDCVETFDDEQKQDYQRHLLRDWGLMYGTVVDSSSIVETLAV